MPPVSIRQNPQNPHPVTTAVVVADTPLLLDAENVRQVAAERRERRAGVFRQSSEASVMLVG